MPQRPRVALLIDTLGVHGRRILQGIAGYLRSHQSWTVVLEHREVESTLPRWFDTWRGDGVISRWSGPRVSEALLKLDAAVVDVSSREPAFGLPRITSDDRAVGSLAAEHLLERSFRFFGFYGLAGELWSTRRRDGFVGTVCKAGLPVEVYETSMRGHHHQPSEAELVQIGRWLKSLPKPVGVMVCKDLRGPFVLRACQRFGLRVPDDVAVVGADDDAVLCELNDPPLSSVICGPERIGHESAALLDRLMAGGEAGFEELFLPPVGVATRQSTDILAIDDERVVDAVRFIRANACHGITVCDVLGHVSLSRTTLDRRFRRYLRRSPQAEIRAVQLNRAKQLLTETDHPVARIAELTGFRHTEYFHFAFKRMFDCTPRQFREDSRSARSRGPSAEANGPEGRLPGRKDRGQNVKDPRRVPHPARSIGP
jgi:LacI family transcriptional regulator